MPGHRPVHRPDRRGHLPLDRPLAAPQEGTQCTLALYCVQGGVSLPQAGVQAQEGQLLLCRQADESAVELRAHGDTVVMAAAIYTR